MNLLLRRDQRQGMLGKVVFQLDVRAEITQEELKYINHYRLGDTLLYQKAELTDRGSGLLGRNDSAAAEGVGSRRGD